MSHNVQGQGGNGCCPNECPVCGGSANGVNFPSLTASLRVDNITAAVVCDTPGPTCEFTQQFDLVYDDVAEEWQSGDFNPDCGNRLDVWNIKIRCSGSTWQAYLLNSVGLDTGYTNADGTTPDGSCAIWTVCWDALDSNCCEDGEHTVELFLDQPNSQWSRTCCTCICPTLCVAVVIQEGTGTGGDITSCVSGEFEWEGSCPSQHRWSGSMSCADATIDAEIYFDRNEDGDCIICLESECLGLTGDDRTCVAYTPVDPLIDVQATFPDIDFTPCLEPSVITNCCPAGLPETLKASITDLSGCPGPWPADWNLVWNGSAWVGTSSGGCDSITLTLTCSGSDCNGFRLAVSSTCLSASGNAPTTCSCDPFSLTFDQNVGASGCSPCCDGVALRTFRITITAAAGTNYNGSITVGCDCPCCPGQDLPTTLFATFIGGMGCPGFNGLVITLTYDSARDRWAGSETNACDTFNVEFFCVKGATQTWKALFWSDSGTCGGLLSNDPREGASCNLPLNFDGAVPDAACTCCDSPFNRLFEFEVSE